MKLNIPEEAKKWLRFKEYPNGLTVIKYTNKAHFKQAWNEHPVLLDCRGIVVDKDMNIISWPFTKVCNIGENGTKLPDAPFLAVEKINGFMGAYTYSTKYGEIFSTTGTLDSSFVDILKSWFNNVIIDRKLVKEMATNNTLLFEVCDPTDPHFIEEKFGLYLIGARNLETGAMLSEWDLDYVARSCGFMRPNYKVVNNVTTFKSSLAVEKIEGYMLHKDGECVAKYKGPYYSNLKTLCRVSSVEVLEKRLSNPLVNSEFKQTILEYGIVNFIELSEQERIKLLKEV